MPFLALFGVSMPVYEKVNTEETMVVNSDSDVVEKKVNSRLIYVLSFLYFAFSCGMEGFFQSQTFTFGICGPHHLPPKKVKTNWCS